MKTLKTIPTMYKISKIKTYKGLYGATHIKGTGFLETVIMDNGLELPISLVERLCSDYVLKVEEAGKVNKKPKITHRSILDKEGNFMDKPTIREMLDLSTPHLKNILAWCTKDKIYSKAIQNELLTRQEAYARECILAYTPKGLYHNFFNDFKYYYNE